MDRYRVKPIVVRMDLCVCRSCFLRGTTRIDCVTWQFPQLLVRQLLVETAGTHFNTSSTHTVANTHTHSVKIHDLSDLKGVYTIIDIEEEKGMYIQY